MRYFSARSLLLATAMAVSSTSVALAEGWTPLDKTAVDSASVNPTFPGSIRAGSREEPVKAGDTTKIAIKKATPGMTVTVMHGTELVTPEPVTVGDEKTASIPVEVPADAKPGIYPLTVITQNPDTISLSNLKVSEIVPPMNAEAYTLESVDVGERAYQSEVSKDNKLFVASALAGENGDSSKLVRIDAATMKIEAEAELPNDAEGKPINVFGIGVDNAHGKVWASATKSETVVVFNADDMSVAKVFPEGSLYHPRDVIIDEANNRAYVSSAMTPFVAVYDTETLEQLGKLEFVAERGREQFGTMNLELDAEGGKLYSTSRYTPWIGWVDVNTKRSTTFKIPEAKMPTDIARDPATGRLYVVSQDTDNLVVLDADGKLIADTYIGAGGVSVVWDAETSQAVAATRAGETIVVVDGDGKIVANIPVHETPNHLSVGPDGTIYLVAMYGEKGDESKAGSVTKITAAQ